MQKYNSLLERISNELGIFKGENETERDFKSRIIYSAVGRLAYSSLWDMPENGEPVSIEHFKRRVKTAFEDYCDAFPEVKISLKDSIGDLFYKMFESTGQLYHTPYRISPVVYSASQTNNVMFLRGQPLGESVRISGLGAYVLSENIRTNNSPAEMFQLSDKLLSDKWQQVIETAHWQMFSKIDDYEFLEIPPPIDHYWCGKIPKGIAMARSKNVPRIYCLVKSENGNVFYSQLPEWKCSGRSRGNLSNGCLMCNGILPPSRYSVDGNIVRVKIGYLFSKADLDFFRFYSWPEYFNNIESDFHRVLDKNVFFAVKKIFESAGYKFEEEKLC